MPRCLTPIVWTGPRKRSTEENHRRRPVTVLHKRPKVTDPFTTQWVDTIAASSGSRGEARRSSFAVICLL
ncbi:hypothetical protein JG688_00014944 [Phytophthora aleatoria]|uniref:Uncharacterized protein n=1 Tax=Phytophthora aleatoria TaxID=2496075 RepID=A0A8J5M2Z8_9STRA|nr:hypothetical protein JG688_00014944 [Phytophthora aleatoria]